MIDVKLYPYLLAAGAVWLLGSAFLPPPSLGQPLDFPAGPESLPAENLPADPESLPLEGEPAAPELPPPTLGPGDAPGGYSPVPYDAKTSKQFNLYRLDVGDGVSVNVQDYPEFSFSSAIDPEGNVRVPFLGKLPLVGLTLEEVEAKIAYELGRRYLQEDPKVIASLSGIRPAQITILGEVVRPGFYTVGAGTPLTAILGLVGGSTTRADLRSIIVRRRLVDGTVLEEKVDLYTPLIEGKKLPDFRPQGGDAVIVSKLIAGQDRGYDRAFIARTTLTQPSITIRVIAPTFPSGVALRDLTLRNGSTYLDALAALPSQVPWVTREEVILMRFDREQGRVISQTLNRVKAVENQDIAQFMPLEEDDVIIVSRTVYGKVLEAFNILTQPIRDILGWSNFLFGLGNTFDNFSQ